MSGIFSLWQFSPTESLEVGGFKIRCLIKGGSPSLRTAVN